MLFFCISFYYSNQSSGQSQQNPYQYSDSLIDLNDSLIDIYDSIFYQDVILSESYKYIDTCELDFSIRPIVVRFEGSANVCLEGNAYSPLNNKTIEIYESNNMQTPIITKTYNAQNPYIEDLPLNRSYTIKTKNYCNNSVIISSFNTFEKTKQEVEILTVSNKVMNILNTYDDNNSQPTIYSFYEALITSPDIPYYEKLSVLQDYILDGRLLPQTIKVPISELSDIYVIDGLLSDMHRFTIPTIDIGRLVLRNDCDCKITQTFESTEADKHGEIRKEYYDILFDYTAEPERKLKENGRHIWQNYSRGLAARYEQLWHTFTRKTPYSMFTKYNSVGNAEGSVLPAGYGGIRYEYKCYDRYNSLTTNCCDSKEVSVGYSYIAEAHVKLYSTGTNTMSISMAKDVAILSIDNGVDDPYLEYKMIGTHGKYEKFLDNEKIVDGVKSMLKGIYRITTKGLTETESVIDDFAESAKNFIAANKQWDSTNGNRYDKTIIGTLLHGDKTVTLYHNKPLLIKIYSGSHLIQEGQGY